MKAARRDRAGAVSRPGIKSQASDFTLLYTLVHPCTKKTSLYYFIRPFPGLSFGNVLYMFSDLG